MPERVYIVILNWNGWRDTIECLESVFRLDYPRFTVVVCDNGSSDNSLEQIRRWACGKQLAECKNSDLAHLVLPPIQKPIAFWDTEKCAAQADQAESDARLVLIQTRANLGYAGGCNVGIRYALQQECDYVWLLNNDTVVDPQALTCLVEMMRGNSRLGMCGSLNLSYYSPQEIQAVGGERYNPWAACVRSAGGPAKLDQFRPINPGKIDYVNGASMMVTREFLQNVGLMEESYFLYFEELDWTMRGKGLFEIGCAPRSMIYHKEGGSIGTHRDRTLRSPLSDQCSARNRVLFTGRYYPALLPSVLFWVALAVIHRLVTGDIARARLMAKAAVEGLQMLLPMPISRPKRRGPST